MMKILFVTDIHGSASSTAKVLSAAKEHGVDYLAILGDTLYHGPRNRIPDGYDPKATAAMLNEWKHKIIAVRGNCDSEVDQMIIQYPMMGDYAWILTDGHRIFMTHGHLWHQEKLPDLEEGDAFVYGHYHWHKAEKHNGVHIWNPGSPTLPKDGTVASYGLYENGMFRIMCLETGNVVAEDHF